MRREQPRDQSGFTLIELMVSVLLLAIVSSALYTVMMSGVRSSEKARSVANTAQEARLGFNRMIRDTREAAELTNCTAAPFETCYRVRIDFNGDGAYTNPNSLGDYEDLVYEFVSADNIITVNGETLIAGVFSLPGENVFTYLSNDLTYDANGDGITTAPELDSSGVAGVGNGNGILDGPELNYLTSVSYAFRIEQGEACVTGPQDPCETFFAEAQLRNRR
jgi:prepilin-type N-terminal cleavage/methylation domain-containing protein